MDRLASRLLGVALTASAILTTIGCPINGGKPPRPPPGVATCASVCAHWTKLDCSVANPTEGGASCEEVCINVQSSGIIRWDLECRASISSCEEIDRCESD